MSQGEVSGPPSLTSERLRSDSERYYSSRFAEHGPTPRGVDWNGEDSQVLRFTQLLQVVDREGPFSLLDYGCGYGALLARMRAGDWDCDYRGFDLSEPMIEHARLTFEDDHRATFASREDELEPADYAVASGVFNVRQEATVEAWSAYVLESLDRLDFLGRNGFSFNLLTSYSDPQLMRDHLWYADPTMLFNHCKYRYSRQVALLHDYGLFEFTIIVRKP